jgi:sialidase-1
MPHVRACIVVVLLASAALAALAPQPPMPRLTDVYVAGEGAYHTYRIPSVIATPKGTLLAFAEGRRAGAGDAGDIDLVLKRSLDGGASWSPMQVIGDDGRNTFGNPCSVVDITFARMTLDWLTNGKDAIAALRNE